jgi:hypothetical protein
MGHVFKSNARFIWSPSRDVALAFLAQVHHLEERLTTQSGLTEVMSDTIDTNYYQLCDFLRRIGSWGNLGNPSIQLLLRGVIVHLLALLSTATSLPDDLLEFYPTDWLDEAMSLSRRSMDNVQ